MNTYLVQVNLLEVRRLLCILKLFDSAEGSSPQVKLPLFAQISDVGLFLRVGHLAPIDALGAPEHRFVHPCDLILVFGEEPNSGHKARERST